MYSNSEIAEARQRLSRFVWLYGAMAAVLLAVFTVALIMRFVWLAYLSLIILALASVFLWGVFGIRLVSFNRFLNEMQHGLEREAEGVLASVSEEDATREGLEFRALRILTGESAVDSAGGRLLYVDASRLPLPVQAGQKVRCRLFGNYIKDIRSAE